MADLPKLDKQHCRDLAPTPYHYAGYWEGHYRYIKGSYQEGGFYEMACLDEDMTADNLAFMAKHNLTRIT